MVWTTPAIDAKLGLLIFSTGNPNPDLDGTIRQGDNLYSDSIVALDVQSGALKWYYQEVKHDGTTTPSAMWCSSTYTATAR
jgi:alcohol dehydrogenase (cytochrome c)